LEDELSVVWADRPTGYLVDDLDQARFRFAEVRGVVGDWENAA